MLSSCGRGIASNFFFYSLHVNLSLKRYRKKDRDNFSNCFKNRIIDCSVLAISFVSWSSSIFELLVSNS